MATRVGILTFHHVPSFGAVLQAYALCRTLKELGCEACVIDYRPEYLVGPHRGLGRRPTSIVNSVIRKWRFRRFRRRLIPTSNYVYRSEHDLRSHPPGLDAYVCGSDQVWNLRILEGRLDAGFFLSFAPDGARRIAYAPSLGDASFSGARREEAATVLSRFDALSAREETGRALIRETTGREAPLVLDPSLLIEDYSEAAKKPPSAPAQYILAYPLEYSPQFLDLVRRVQQRTQLPVVNVGTSRLPGAQRNCTCLGPSEWLGWMRGASFVCTNSFHGTAYSIIFRRNFVFVPLQWCSRLAERTQGLLEQMGLPQRFLADPTVADGVESCLQPVDYATAEPLLRAAIDKSRSYLRNAVFGQRE